jgi:very-short-patch-repair endonuclease
MAAVLACGPGAVLSHRDAAALHDLRRPASRGAIHVTTTGRNHPRPGIHVHNVRRLHPSDRAVIDGIPVTSVHRTLLDYAETARLHEFRWAFEAYDRHDLLDMRALDAVIARSPGRRGVRPLKAVIAQYRGPAPETRSANERRFLALIRDAGLPEPSVNVVVAGIVVDFFWPQQRLVVEVDSYTYHHTPKDRAEDRRKDRIVKAAGCDVLRVTDAELSDALNAVVGDVAERLSAGAAASGR